jgi:hypothetical protein
MALPASNARNKPIWVLVILIEADFGRDEQDRPFVSLFV